MGARIPNTPAVYTWGVGDLHSAVSRESSRTTEREHGTTVTPDHKPIYVFIYVYMYIGWSDSIPRL